MTSPERHDLGSPRLDVYQQRAVRRLISRVLGKLRFVPAWGRLLRVVRGSSPTEIWIGDSHAMTFNQGLDNGWFLRGPRGILILRDGARLMWSVAQKGFSPRVLRVASVVQRIGRPGALVPVFSAGEIDVRVHLAARPEERLDFVEDYVQTCRDLAARLRAERIGFVVPPPPCDVSADEDWVWYPVSGSFSERMIAFTRLRAALTDAVDRLPGGFLLDFTPVLADEHGGLPRAMTWDGCHVNDDAVERVAAARAQQLA